MIDKTLDFLTSIDNRTYDSINRNNMVFTKNLESDSGQRQILEKIFTELHKIIEEKYPENGKLLLFYSLSLWNKELKVKKILPFRKDENSDKMLKIINENGGRDVSFITEILYEYIVKKDIIVISNARKMGKENLSQKYDSNVIPIQYQDIEPIQEPNGEVKFKPQNEKILIDDLNLQCIYKNYLKNRLSDFNVFKDFFLHQLSNFISLMKWSSPNSAHYILIPYRGWMDESIGALFLQFSENITLNDDFINNLKLFSIIVNRIYGEIGGKFMHKIAINKSLQSAIAAIMSRNGSHNIGSHVISAASSNNNTFSDNQNLLKYIQQRMDFVATITTDWPNWSYPVWITKDLMRRFYEQRLLLKYIAKADGLDAFEFQPKEKDQEKETKLLIKIERFNNNGLVEKLIDIENNQSVIQEHKAKLEFDIPIAIPGGIIGHQAFYTILENIIRNSAKHGWAKNKPDNKRLEITIRLIEREDEDYNIVEIYDNVSLLNIINNDLSLYETDDSGNPKFIKENESAYKELPLHKQINQKLMQSFIDENGKLKKENWGLAELKICAGYLNGKSIEQIGTSQFKDKEKKILFEENDEQEDDGFISAVPHKLKDNTYTLGFKFPIKKPKEVLIIGCNNSDEHAEKYSIYYSNSPKNMDYEFIVLFDGDKNNTLLDSITEYSKENDNTKKSELLETIKSAIEMYPFRLFIVSDRIKKDNLPEFLKKRFVLFGERYFKKILEFSGNDGNKPKDYEEFRTWLYSKWVDYLFSFDLSRSNEDNEIKLQINLEGTDNSGGKNDEIAEIMFKEFKDSIINLLNKNELVDKKLPEKLKRIDWGIIEKWNEIWQDKLKNKVSIFSTAYDFTFAWYKLALTIQRIESEQENISITNSNLLGIFQDNRIIEESDGKKSYQLQWNEGYQKEDRKKLKSITEHFWEATKNIFKKYEEEIETLPKSLKANGDRNSDWKMPKFLNKYINIFSREVNENEEINIDIAYNRHQRRENCAIYSEALSGAQIYFSFLSNVENNAKEKTVLQLLENALIRMLVIDERVAQYQQKQKEYHDVFQKMQITIPNTINYNGNEVSLINDEADKNENGKTYVKDLFIDNLKIERHEFDLLIIHQGVLEKLLGTDKVEIGKFLKDIKEKIPFVLITSGRGAPSTLPEDAKLLAFSNVESFLLKSYPEKYLLSQVAMKTNIDRKDIGKKQ